MHNIFYSKYYATISMQNLNIVYQRAIYQWTNVQTYHSRTDSRTHKTIKSLFIRIQIILKTSFDVIFEYIPSETF